MHKAKVTSARLARDGGFVRPARAKANAEITDRSPWDWYAESCRCGVAPGECRAHPRARPSQRPPAGDWRVWAYVAGRGAGKTRAGACWIQHRAQAGTMKLGCLIAPTAADIRDVMVEGPSGLLADRAAVVPASVRIFQPADGHPEEDLIDALRGGIRDAFPEGLVPKPDFRHVHVSQVL